MSAPGLTSWSFLPSGIGTFRPQHELHDVGFPDDPSFAHGFDGGNHPAIALEQLVGVTDHQPVRLSVRGELAQFAGYGCLVAGTADVAHHDVVRRGRAAYAGPAMHEERIAA